MEVMADRGEWAGLSSSTSVLLSFSFSLLVANQSRISAMQSWIAWMARCLLGVMWVKGQIELGVIGINVEPKVVLASNVTKREGVGGE